MVDSAFWLNTDWKSDADKSEAVVVCATASSWNIPATGPNLLASINNFSASAGLAES